MAHHWLLQGSVVVVALLLGGVAGGAIERNHPHSPFASQVREMGDFEFINPLLECEIAEGLIDAPKQNFKDDLTREVARIKDEKRISTMAVYFRDLNNGPAFGVNAEERFIPASLLKVPVMMAYFELEEDEPGIFQKEVILDEVYPSPGDGVQHIPPEIEVKKGEAYTIGDLVRRAVVYSDNQAVTYLIEHIAPQYIRNIYGVLGVPDGVLNGPDGRLTVREYSSFFRILFNSSYLDRRNSEEALRILSETKYSNGIVKKLPRGTKVAHKFGEAGFENDHQIHDCGIVYYPDHPYLLCVMTRGKDIAVLEEAIADSSLFVWNNIESQYR